MKIFDIINMVTLDEPRAGNEPVNVLASIVMAVSRGGEERDQILRMFDDDTDIYLIKEASEEGLFWSNADGYVSSGFSFFDRNDIERLNLPIGGEWIALDDLIQRPLKRAY